MTLWPRLSLPAASGRAPASVSISVVLPAPLRPTNETCSPRSSHSSPCSSRVRGGSADLDLTVFELEHDAPGPLDLAELERE